MKDLADTICALSTPPGRSGLAVVRLSGGQSLALVQRIFRARSAKEPLAFRRAMLGRVVDPGSGSEFDEVIATCFQGPHSYTGEDMCEFSMHGSPVLVAALLDSLCALGARLAEPGEFTMRAFLRGRMDLTQAEAVRDIIGATTLYQAQVAARQRDGALARAIHPVKQLLTDVIVQLESAVEFVEENLPVESREAVVQKLGEATLRLARWVESYRMGKVIRDGFSMALVGRPNVGKSSLFNALLAQDRSIVTEMPGTTRDLVSEFTSMGGIPVRLVDTAGIHDSEHMVEKLGIDRSMQAIADTDAVILVLDTSRPVSPEDRELKGRLRELRCIMAMNKSDLPSCWSAEDKSGFADAGARVDVSAKTMSGIEALRTLILEKILGARGGNQDGILVTNLRHCRNLEAAKEHLEQAAVALRDGVSEEFALIDLHAALRKLGEITGETGVEDFLTEIFSRFCVGK
jgi:tRNA modification GTPase